MSELAWRFFFWITPRWLSRKWQVYTLRRIVERYPAEVERKIREALAQQFGATRSEEELAALSKDALDLMLHPQARKRRFSQISPAPLSDGLARIDSRIAGERWKTRSATPNASLKR